MRWPWWHRRKPSAPRPAVNRRRQELEKARGDPGGGIRRPALRCGGDDTAKDGGEELERGGRWPEMFCTGE